MNTTIHFLIAALLLLAILTPFSHGQETDLVNECEGWAERGECTLNPKYMHENCAASCKMQALHDEQMKACVGKFFISNVYVCSFTSQDLNVSLYLNITI